jgi:ATP-dependent DNA helicase RecQ
MAANTDWNRVRATFQQIWGYADFRPPQGEVIGSLLSGQDALIVMPTGGGKSICFQLPALLQTGVTLVVSPLVALMENQVQELQQRRLPAAVLHSQLPTHQRQQTLWALKNQRLRLLYLSPETLLSASVWNCLSQPHLQVNGLILDEAHCLAQWGDTFRPAYRRLGAVRPALLQHKPPGTQMAIAVFTATADPQTQKTIQQVLGLQHPAEFRVSPYRANLDLRVRIAWTPHHRRQQLLRFIQQRPGQPGLVYVRTRRDAEALSAWLMPQGLKTAVYHAGLSADIRRQVEQAWLSGDLLFVICTCAFGMGINKSNCRWIVHFHPPLLLSEYLQEVGRAGRDHHPAQALLMMSEPTGWLDPDDRQRRRFFEQQLHKQHQSAQALVQQLPTQGTLQAVTQQFPDGEVALALLHSSGQLEWQDPFHYHIHRAVAPQFLTQIPAIQLMTQYLQTRKCRWKFILEAFGFSQEAEALQTGCGHCDRCVS